MDFSILWTHTYEANEARRFLLKRKFLKPGYPFQLETPVLCPRGRQAQ